MFASSLFISVLFLGGYLSPFGKYLTSGWVLYFEQAFWLFLNSFLIIFLAIWVRATLPRFAPYDLLKFSFVVLLPVSILNLFLMVIFKFITGGVYA